MLQVQRIRDHKEAFIKALKKRGMDATPVINQVLEAEKKRTRVARLAVKQQ